jgi:radical SAM family uncharacterized protein/radical SAM-linked protein
MNAVCKDFDQAAVRFALVFPDLYELGMSHLGLQILYGILNAQPDVLCERAFSPWFDMEGLLRSRKLPLGSLESKRPLYDFDIVGFSLQYELSYTNVLNIMALAGIPVVAADRDADMPIIIGGGPCAFNPEPLADFFDAFVLGDGEDVVLEIVDTVRRWKAGHKEKTGLLEDLTSIPGVYVPSLFHVDYETNGVISEIKGLMDDYPDVSKRTVVDLNASYYPLAPLVPCVRSIHDRLSVEVTRGCTRGCRFCHAGYVYRPVRERNPHRILDIIEESLKRTGYDEISLLSLSTGDYTGINPLLTALMARYGSERIAVSLPSLRVGTLTEGLIEQIKKVRKTGFTLAPEAATEHLQRIVNKVTDEGELLDTARLVFTSGWNLVKLYFMIGLPGERDEDIRQIVELSRRVARQGLRASHKARVNVSVSTFVPKAHTPFQWTGQLTMEEIADKQEYLKRTLRGKGLRLKWHDARMSFLEGVFARGDRRLGQLLLAAHRHGCRFDGWTEHLHWEGWLKAFQEAGIDGQFYASRQRGTVEVMPWGHLDSGVTPEFLAAERKKSLRGALTEDCRQGPCGECGACNGAAHVALAGPLPLGSVAPASPPHQESWARRIRTRFIKLGDARFCGHLDMVDAFIRSIRRGGIPVRFSQGFHPMPRIWFSQPLPLGTMSLSEMMDMELAHYVDAEECKIRLNRELPYGLRVVDAQGLIVKGKPLVTLFEIDRFLISLECLDGAVSVEKLETCCQQALAASELIVVQKKNDETHHVDARPYIELLRAIPTDGYRPVAPMPDDIPPVSEFLKADVVLELGLRRTGRIRPKAVVQSLLGLTADESLALEIVKTESLPPLL